MSRFSRVNSFAGLWVVVFVKYYLHSILPLIYTSATSFILLVFPCQPTVSPPNHILHLIVLRLLVGAPRDVAADGNRTGGVYRCAVQHGATCQRVTAFDSLEGGYAVWNC